MNNITRALTAILANTAFVWGKCAVKPDSDGLVTIPATWTNVPQAAFYECADLKEVVIPRGVTEIFNYAFYKSGLEVILFESNSQLETIGTYVFSYCADLKEVVIPRGVTEISHRAFYKSGLEVILFESNSQLETIGNYAFSETSIVSIEIPKVTSIGSGVSYFPLRYLWSCSYSSNILNK